VRAVGLPILSPRVDIANVRLEFDSGCVANFTASRVSTERVRKLRFFQPHQYISLDYTRQDVIVFTVEDMGAVSPEQLAAAAQHPSAPAGISITKPKVVAEEPLHAELRAFLDSVHTRSKPVVPAEEGRRALAVALDVLGAIREHIRRANLESVMTRPS
jgi:predicted dehydrogenase